MVEPANHYEDKTPYTFTGDDWDYLRRHRVFAEANEEALLVKILEKLCDPTLPDSFVKGVIACWLMRSIDGGETRIWWAFKDSLNTLLSVDGMKKNTPPAKPETRKEEPKKPTTRKTVSRDKTEGESKLKIKKENKKRKQTGGESPVIFMVSASDLLEFQMMMNALKLEPSGLIKLIPKPKPVGLDDIRIQSWLKTAEGQDEHFETDKAAWFSAVNVLRRHYRPRL